LYGDTIDIDGPSLRDHTWGPRKILTNQESRLRGAWPFAVVDKDNSFQACCTNERPAEDDPMIGTTERVVSGWHTKDGKKGTLTGGTRRVLERGADGRPLRELIEAKDDQGRTVKLEGVWRNWLKLPLWTDLFCFWGLCHWSFDDGRECVGEMNDYLFIRHYRRLYEMLRDQETVASASASA
jgi:hypothetical protein